jgi:hypothetical protein
MDATAIASKSVSGSSNQQIGTRQNIISIKRPIIDPRYLTQSGPEAHPKSGFQTGGMISNDVSGEKNTAATTEFVVVAESSNKDNKNDTLTENVQGMLDDNNDYHHPTEENQTRPETSHDNGTPRPHLTHLSNKNDRIDAFASKTYHDDRERTRSDSVDNNIVTYHRNGSARNRSKKEENRKSKKQKSKAAESKRREEKDRELAQHLQDTEDRASQKSSLDREQNKMMATNIGKAVLAVERIIQLVESTKIANDLFDLGLESVVKDDMVFFAERLLVKQEEFKAKGIPSEVDIGYHYTGEASMDDIQTNGLMTREDRIKNKIHVASKGAIFGDGIYTANNPTSFMKYGRVGLIVARLQGKPVRVPGSLRKNHRTSGNTIIGDKSAKSRWRWPKSDSLHEIVLQSSSQCLPLVRYDRKALRKNRQKRNWDPDAYILDMADSLKVVLDEIVNGREAASRPLPTVAHNLV